MKTHEVNLLSIPQYLNRTLKIDLESASTTHLIFIHATWLGGISHTALNSQAVLPSTFTPTLPSEWIINILSHFLEQLHK